MIKKVYAARFDRFMNSGRTSPALCHCVDQSEESAGQFVVKCFGAIEHEKKGLAFELLGSLFARYFEIETPVPAIVEVSADFAQVVQTVADIRKTNIAKSIGVNFGSTYMYPVSTLPVDKPLTGEILRNASTIFAFDALIQNADRRVLNPNLFVSTEQIIVIDHEMAFGFWADIFLSPEPWNLVNQKYLESHVFYSRLKGTSPDFSDFGDKLTSLSDSNLMNLISLCPREWLDDVEEKIVKHVQQIRANADKFIDSLSEVLL